MQEMPRTARRAARTVLVATACLTGVLGYVASGLVVDYNFEQFFPAEDPETTYYRDFRSHFASDNDFVLFALPAPAGVYDPVFLRNVEALTAACDSLPYAIEVTSPTRFAEPLMFGGAVFRRPLLRYEEGPEALAADSARIAQRPDILGNLISTDATACAVVLQHAPELHKAGCDSLAVAVEALGQRPEFAGLHATGRALAQRYYIDRLQWELVLFTSVGLLLLVVVLWLSFRSWVGILAPLGIVLLSVVWTLGILALSGGTIDVMTVVMPTILFVVGVSDVVHILARFNDERIAGASPYEALVSTYKEVGLATFLTSLTTAVGFLTLVTASIAPVKHFGVFTAVGVGVAYICAFTVLPALLVLAPPAPRAQRGSDGPWQEGLARLLRWTWANGKVISWVAIALALFSLTGIQRVRIDNRLLEDLTDDDPLRKEFAWFEAHFAGVRPFELAVEVPPHLGVFHPAVLRETEAIAAKTEQLGAGAVIAPSRILALANRWRNGDAPQAQRLPASDEELSRLAASVNRGGGKVAMARFANADAGLIRIAGRTGDDGALEHTSREEELLAWHRTAFPNSSLRLHPTGTARLIDRNNADLTENLTWGMAVSVLAIALIAGLMFRSLRVVAISIAVNALPIAAIGGYMGWAGIDLKVSTGIVFCIAFGIAVDDTIHFLSRLRIELSKGLALPAALRATHRSTGKAIILTSVILCAGFSVLTLSDFAGTVFLGAALAGSLALAVACDLLLLPWLLLKFYRVRRSSDT